MSKPELKGRRYRQQSIPVLLCLALSMLCILPLGSAVEVSLLVVAQATDSTPLAGVYVAIRSDGILDGPYGTQANGQLAFNHLQNATAYNLTAQAPIGYTPTWINRTFTANATGNLLTLVFTAPPPQNALLVIRVLDQDSNPLNEVDLSFTKGALLATQGKTNSTGYFQAILTRGNYNMTAKKSLYDDVVTPISLTKDGSLNNPTLGLVMSIKQQPAKGVYVVFTSQQLANIEIVGIGQINSFRWTPIQTPEILQVYYTPYNSPQEVLHYTTVFQGATYTDPSGKYFIRFTGSISLSGQAQFDVWSTQGTTQAVIVDAPGLNLPYVGTPGKTYQIPVSTKSGDTVDVKLNGKWFASFQWSPVTINNQTLPQAVILDTDGNKKGFTYMTKFNQTLIEYGGNQGFGLVLYRMIGSGTDSTAIWYIYSDLPITITPNIGFGTRPINLSTNPSIAGAGDVVTVTFVIPTGVIFSSQTGVSLVPNDYDQSYGLQVQQVDVTQGSWQVTFKPTNEGSASRDYSITISAVGNDGAKYFGRATISVSPHIWFTVWFWMFVGFAVIIIVSVAAVLRRRRNEPAVEQTMQ